MWGFGFRAWGRPCTQIVYALALKYPYRDYKAKSICYLGIWTLRAYTPANNYRCDAAFGGADVLLNVTSLSQVPVILIYSSKH